MSKKQLKEKPVKLGELSPQPAYLVCLYLHYQDDLRSLLLKLNFVQKAVAHGVYGGEDNVRKVQKRFNSPTGKLLAYHYKI